MSAMPSSAALAVIEPAFSETEKLASAGFLAGYSGLTREAYTLDLRQFTACAASVNCACSWRESAMEACLCHSMSPRRQRDDRHAIRQANQAGDLLRSGSQHRMDTARRP